MRTVVINYLRFEGFFLVVEFGIDGLILSEDYFENYTSLISNLKARFLLNNPTIKILPYGDDVRKYLNQFNNVF